MTTPSHSEVLQALSDRKNVLLEGPPGTGKTRLIADVVARLSGTATGGGGGRPAIAPSTPGQPFTSTAGTGAPQPLPTSMNIEWVTFHQSYTYEEFILGRRPVPDQNGIRIEPQFGLLMSMAVILDLPGTPDACLIVIDEVNRANASQVFGEFITLLDPDYRRTVNGKPNPAAVAPHLPGLRYTAGYSEPIALLSEGLHLQLKAGWTFPEHVYVLATMNSVDKAALPLDSALTRRFHRLRVGPDLEALASALGLSWSSLSSAAAGVRAPGGTASTLSAEETTVFLLERLNHHIALELGEDFELGHGLAWPVVRSPAVARWDTLVDTWDKVLLPQMLERFAGRTDVLRRVLKVGQAPPPFVFGQRRLLGVTPDPDSPPVLPELAHQSPADAVYTLQQLAV